LKNLRLRFIIGCAAALSASSALASPLSDVVRAKPSQKATATAPAGSRGIIVQRRTSLSPSTPRPSAGAGAATSSAQSRGIIIVGGEPAPVTSVR
jgi:hypothetical protein